MPAYSYTCACKRQFIAVQPMESRAFALCSCGGSAQLDFGETVRSQYIDSFKPFTEATAFKRPVRFNSRAERDSFLAARGLTYDRLSNPKLHRHDWDSDAAYAKVAQEAAARVSAGERQPLLADNCPPDVEHGAPLIKDSLQVGEA